MDRALSAGPTGTDFCSPVRTEVTCTPVLVSQELGVLHTGNVQNTQQWAWIPAMRAQDSQALLAVFPQALHVCGLSEHSQEPYEISYPRFTDEETKVL